MKRILLMAAFLAALLCLPASAAAQFVPTLVGGIHDSGGVVAAGVTVLPLKFGPVSVGAGAAAGIFFDRDDPDQFEKMHAHPTAMVFPAAHLKLSKNWGIMAAYAWGWLPKKAHNHISNYKGPVVGVTFGF